MELTVKDERKLVEIWLTNAEKSDPVLRAGLQGIYDGHFHGLTLLMGMISAFPLFSYQFGLLDAKMRIKKQQDASCCFYACLVQVFSF